MKKITRILPIVGSTAGGAGFVRFAFLIPVLFLVACANHEARDLRLRQQLMGTWSQGDSAEVTFLPDGSFHSHAKSGANDAKHDGTWDVRDGVLVISTNLSSVPGIPDPSRHVIVSLNARHLTVLGSEFLIPQSSAKTNVWRYE